MLDELPELKEIYDKLEKNVLRAGSIYADFFFMQHKRDRFNEHNKAGNYISVRGPSLLFSSLGQKFNFRLDPTPTDPMHLLSPLFILTIYTSVIK
jgi:hypothetical protein